MPGSPYSISFKQNVPESSGMELMNVSVYSCGDSSLGCSCGDCPLSPVCSSSEPPSPKRRETCSVRIGFLKVRVDAIHINCSSFSSSFTLQIYIVRISCVSILLLLFVGQMC